MFKGLITGTHFSVCLTTKCGYFTSITTTTISLYAFWCTSNGVYMCYTLILNVILWCL